MRLRVTLRPVSGEGVVRDVVDGLWEEPVGEADQILGEGLWALPGLVDGHAHLATGGMGFDRGDPQGAERRARAALGAGVLLVLDKGWSDLTAVDLVEGIAPEERPDIEAAGRILSTEGGYIPNFSRTVAPGRIGADVEEAAAEGVGWVKLIGDWPRKGIGPVANFSEEEMRTAVEMAGVSGSRVAVHTMAREVPSAAVRAGVQSIEHGLFLDESDLGLLGERGGMWVPTILRMEAVVRQLGEASSGGTLIVEGLGNVSRLLPLAVEAGVSVLAGTDRALETHEVGREAIRLHELGLSRAEAVNSISSNGYRATGRSDVFAVGSPADAVLFPDDPTLDLAVLAHPTHVIRKGRVVG